MWPVTDFTLPPSVFSGARKNVTLNALLPGDDIAYVYEGKWYEGSILDVCVEEEDMRVSSPMPNGPAQSFFYPAREDTLWVPLPHIIRQVTLQSANWR